MPVVCRLPRCTPGIALRPRPSRQRGWESRVAEAGQAGGAGFEVQVEGWRRTGGGVGVWSEEGKGKEKARMRRPVWVWMAWCRVVMMMGARGGSGRDVQRGAAGGCCVYVQPHSCRDRPWAVGQAQSCDPGFHLSLPTAGVAELEGARF